MKTWRKIKRDGLGLGQGLTIGVAVGVLLGYWFYLEKL